MDDCTNGWYWNLPSISANGGSRFNPYLPGFQSQIIENSFIDSVSTGGDLWYEQNEALYYPMFDVTIGASSGTWTVGNYIQINTWDTATSSWAYISAAVEDTTVSSRTGTFNADNFFLIETRLCTGGSEPGTACVVDGDCAGGGACDDITEIANGKVDAASGDDLDLSYRSNSLTIDTDDTVVEVDNLTDKTPLDAYASWSSSSHNEIRVLFQGTRSTPAVSDTVTEVVAPDGASDDASGTWATPTRLNPQIRTRQQEFSMNGSPSTWKWLIPTDMTSSTDLGQKTIMSVGTNSTFTGAQINYSGAIGSIGLKVGGQVSIEGESNATSPCDTAGCLDLRNPSGGTSRLMASPEIAVGTTQTARVPNTSGGNPMLAPLPRNHPRAGLGYLYQVGWVGSTHTGDAYCASAVIGSEGSTVVCHGEHGQAANGDDGHNSDCTGSGAPWACCSGAGTGTCPAVMIEACTTTLDPGGSANHSSHWATVVCNESVTFP
jgi:hypothetical protein